MSTNDGQQHGGSAPQLHVLAQYTKDFSFKNLSAPKSLRQSGHPPTINIQIDVNTNQLSSTDFEVELKLVGKTEASGTTLFSFELVYAGVFRLQNIEQEQTGPTVMIECPRLLFPFARNILSKAILNGGFPPLRIDPVDFVELYRQKMKQPEGAPVATGLA